MDERTRKRIDAQTRRDRRKNSGCLPVFLSLGIIVGLIILIGGVTETETKIETKAQNLKEQKAIQCEKVERADLRFEPDWWKTAGFSDEIQDESNCSKLATLATINANRIRNAGYRCDSISRISPMLFKRGIVIHCNEWRYAYDIEDKGGRWVVTVD